MSYQNGPPKIVTDGLVLMLDPIISKSYPGSGNIVYDLSGRGNNGTINGATYWSDGRGSFNFDGVNDYISVPANAQLMTTQFTKSIWFNILNIPVDTSIREVLRQGSFYFLISYRADLNPKLWQIGFHDSFGQKFWYPSALPTNTWQNITLTGNGSNYTIYHNGVSQATGSYIGLNTSGIGEIFIGSYTSFARFINCTVGLVHFYNLGLTSQQVLHNYNATKYRFGL